MHYSEINERGITLVALVLTIIIMLVIAGIAIGTSLDSNGVLTKTSEEIENTNRSIRIKTISEALSKLYIKNQGKLMLSDIPEKINGSNDEVYEVNYREATIGGFTFEDLGINRIIERKLQYYCVGNEKTNKYYLYNIDNGRIAYYEDNTKKIDFSVSFRNQGNDNVYNDAEHNTSFRFFDDNLIVTNDNGEMLYAIKNNKELYELNRASYEGENNKKNKCSITDGTINFNINNTEISGYYAAIKENKSEMTRTIYLVISNGNRDYFYKGTEVYDIDNKIRRLSILDENFVGFFFFMIKD